MNTVKIVLLGFLYEKPLHGYEIKHIIENHMDDWTDIKVGSIYFALNKLTEDGLIQIQAELQEGNRPAKTVYEITDLGKEAFINQLQDLWTKDIRSYYPLDIGIFFMNYLPKELLSKILDDKIDQLEKTVLHLNKHQKELNSNPHVPVQAAIIMSHTSLHTKAELTWLQELKSKLDSLY